MDWLTLVTSISAMSIVEGLFRVVDKFRFKKEEKKEKKESAEQTAVATDHQQIDLGDLFLEKTQKWAQIIEDSARKVVEANSKRDEVLEIIMSDITKLLYEVGEVKTEQVLIIEFLDGDYDKFKIKKGVDNVTKTQAVKSGNRERKQAVQAVR